MLLASDSCNETLDRTRIFEAVKFLSGMRTHEILDLSNRDLVICDGGEKQYNNKIKSNQKRIIMFILL